jgi:cytochrome d ubiquinol oxidase subunit II
MVEFLDYTVVRLCWWFLIGVLWIGFAIMDGHDLGVGGLLLFVAKKDEERRVLINSIAPHWDGNQVWLITAGGAMFAVWPTVYATVFSGMYIVLLGMLWTIFLRAPAFDYRSKIETKKWRYNWDKVIFVASVVTPIVLGAGAGNLFLGLPFTIDQTMGMHYEGQIWQLFSPYALLAGVLGLFMILSQGASYIMVRTEGVIHSRAKTALFTCALLTLICFVLIEIWTLQLKGFVINNIDTNAFSNPFAKTVSVIDHGWAENYKNYSFMMIAPFLVIVSFLVAMLLAKLDKAILAFIATSVGLASIIISFGCLLFPFLVPSSINPNASLTLWDATSSYHTLSLSFIVALIFAPIVLTYTSWVYKIMSGKITEAKIKENTKSLY